MCTVLIKHYAIGISTFDVPTNNRRYLKLEQGTRERSVLTEHFFNVLTEHVLFRSDRTFFSKN